MSGAGQPGFAGLIRSFRLRAGLTQREAAVRAGMSLGGLRDLEQGRVVAPRASTLRRLASAFELSPSDADGLLRSGQVMPGVRIQVLGPLAVSVDGIPVEPISDAQRVLLGVLALSANQPVHHDVLIEAVWDGNPPEAATTVLQKQVSRLRRRLEAEPALITARHDSYRLTISEDRLDLLAFEGLLTRARRARSRADLAASCESYQAAAELWRGQPLADLPTLAVWPSLVTLTHTYQSAMIEYADIAAELGRHNEVVELLHQLVTADPLNESLHARLMVALAGAGRQTDALALFDQLRGRLANELGIDPGRDVVTAHQRVLRQEFRTVTANETAPVSAYQLLPADIADFTGRQNDLLVLHTQLHAAAAEKATAISVIEGMAGVGKTRLAIRFAREVAATGRYEVQLYVDLRGYSDAPAADPAAVLASFLLLLGVPGTQIPADLTSLSALFRDRLQGKSALVLLDNATNEAQLEPLLPAGADKLVLITSRRTLAIDGARSHTLDLFPEEDALALLSNIAGQHRIGTSADMVAAQQVIQLCGRLPLAVALAAHRLRSRSAWTMTDLIRRLDQTATRVDEIAAGSRGIASVFDLSYAALEPDSQRLFRLLGIHPGDDFTIDSATALTDTTLNEAARIVDRLVDEHLVTAITANRYRLHDLLRAYAMRITTNIPEEATEARDRILHWYLHVTNGAREAAFPNTLDSPEAVLDPRHRPTQQPALDDEHVALQWLTDEKATLIAVAISAREHGRPEIAWSLPLLLAPFLELSGDWQAWLAVYEIGLAAARESANAIGEAAMSRSLSYVYIDLRTHLDRAIEYATRAVEIYQQAEHPRGEARALRALGAAHMHNGDPGNAVTRLREALQLARRVENSYLQDMIANDLGAAFILQKRYDDAIRLLKVVARHRRTHGDAVGVAAALHNIGEAHLRAGQYPPAIANLEEAGQLMHLRWPWHEAMTLDLLGTALMKTGQLGEASKCWTRALTIMNRLNHPLADRVRGRLSDLEKVRSVPVNAAGRRSSPCQSAHPR